MTEDTRREFSSLIARLANVERAERPLILSRLLPYLAQPDIPEPVRITAAAHALRAMPDRDRLVRRIARALTTGQSRSRGLERLRRLQNQVETCRSLDMLIDEREQRLRLRCPRCQIRLPRVEMVKHLWNEHELILELGKGRSTARMLELLRGEHASAGTVEPLDRFAGWAGIVGLRRWLAADDVPIEELAPFLWVARDHGAGLCPECFTDVPAAVEPMPEALTFSHGRLAGEGYSIEAGGDAWFRTLRVTTPGSSSIGRRSLAPRAVGTVAAALVLGVALAAARTPTGALTGIALAIIAYLIARTLRSSSRSLADRSVDEAWSRFAGRLVEHPTAARFLTRLCRASVGWGEPEARAWILNAMTRRAGRRVEESDEELQLLAAVRVLQVEDMSRYGRDVTAGVAALAADGFNGLLPADYAEFVMCFFLSRMREPGELGRLRILLLSAAFEAGLAPRDLTYLWAGAPNLKKAMMSEPGHRLGLLFGLWRTRESRSWEAVARAFTVFDLARTSPPTAARVLAHYPDLLLYHRPGPDVDAVLGPVLICARGVCVDGHFVADPDADLQLTNDGRRLTFGPYRIDVSRRLPHDLPDLLRQWLRFRADGLVPFIEESLAKGAKEVVDRIMGPFCRRCLSCGTISAVTAGAVGMAMPS